MSGVIVITGGSRGIGRSTALACVRAGARVVFSYQGNEQAAQSTLDACRAIAGNDCVLAQRGDVRNEDDVIALFEFAREQFGEITGVVNNAGIVAPSMPLAEMDAERLSRVTEINVLGALLVARQAARDLADNGSLVNVGSMAAKLGSPNEYVDYAASKGALDSLTVGLSKELGPRGIRVNCVRPGLIATDIHASGGRPERVAELGPLCPLGRPGEAEEVANAILWLLSDAASYTTGSLIDVAGGR
ncbi:SDR family oxidoreductase [Halomonas huangheensis]|uniref:SDR family oxidoreductase n=1 Tax=Halomonas huangheensis TaxID=1178482 RepID=UPI00192E52CD